MVDIVSTVLSVLNVGGISGVLWMFIGGTLHSDKEFTRMQTDRDTERLAHERTREALRLANARADTGVMTAQIVAQALGGAHALEQGGTRVAPPQD